MSRISVCNVLEIYPTIIWVSHVFVHLLYFVSSDWSWNNIVCSILQTTGYHYTVISSNSILGIRIVEIKIVLWYEYAATPMWFYGHSWQLVSVEFIELRHCGCSTLVFLPILNEKLCFETIYMRLVNDI